MRPSRPLGLFSLLLAGSLCAEDSLAAGAPAASPSTPSTSCKKPEPVVSTCAPNKVLLPVAVPSKYTEGQIAELAAADVNGDGKTDLLLSHSSSFVEVLLSKGDGTFETGSKIEEQVGGEGLVVADFDGDCKPDVLVSSFAGHGTPNSVNFYAGKGNGAFRVVGVTTDLSQGSLATLLAADFNADGKLDFVFTGGNGASGDPTVVYNSGKARFGAGGISHAVGNKYTVGDLTGDGAVEFVATDNSAKQVCVYINNGNGQFDDPACAPLSPSVRPLSLAVADLNGDGRNDVVVCSEGLTAELGTVFNVYLNKGDGTLGDRATYSLRNNPAALVVADVNNDGRPDIAALTGGSDPVISILKNKGNGTFAAKAEEHPIGGTVSSGYRNTLVQGDFKGNGLKGFAALDREHNAVSVIAAECKP